jgi:hypothetical protein
MAQGEWLAMGIFNIVLVQIHMIEHRWLLLHMIADQLEALMIHMMHNHQHHQWDCVTACPQDNMTSPERVTGM